MRERWREIRGVRALIFDIGGTVLSMDHSRIAHCMEESGAWPRDNWVPVAERQARRAADRLVRAGAPADAMIAGIEAAGALLREPFPSAHGDANELHNELRVVD